MTWSDFYLRNYLIVVTRGCGQQQVFDIRQRKEEEGEKERKTGCDFTRVYFT